MRFSAAPEPKGNRSAPHFYRGSIEHLKKATTKNNEPLVMRNPQTATEKKRGPAAGHGLTVAPIHNATFWARVQFRGKDECWPWVGAAYGPFSGSVTIENKVQLAHRVAYALTVGPIPAGMCVCHRCDNPICVNPAHLFLATQKENMWDMSRKLRGKPWGRPQRACNLPKQ